MFRAIETAIGRATRTSSTEATCCSRVGIRVEAMRVLHLVPSAENIDSNPELMTLVPTSAIEASSLKTSVLMSPLLVLVRKDMSCESMVFVPSWPSTEKKTLAKIEFS